jgi:HEAT repeat protein
MIRRFQCTFGLLSALWLGICVLPMQLLQAQSTDTIDQVVDSLFVVASSGELKYRNQVEPAKAKLAELGARAVPRLISKLTTPDARERLTVIRILKKIGAPAVPGLREALRTLSPPIQLKRICWALGDIGAEARDAVDDLIGACDHENWQVREYALRGLGKILGGTPTDEAFNVVSRLMADSVGQTRKSAVWSAGEFQDVAMTNNLLQALGDNYYGARLNAVSALVKIATDSGVTPGNIESVISQISEFVRADSAGAGDLACAALGEIGTKLTIPPDERKDSSLKRILNTLGAQLLSTRELRRAAAVRALGECAPAGEWGILMNLRLTESSVYVIQAIDSAVVRISALD